MDLENKECIGSYILSSPMKNDNGTVIGTVVIGNECKKFEKGMMIMYHIDDVKIIKINSDNFHAIYHYQVILKEKIEKEKEIYSTPNGLNFTGMSANF